VRYNGALMSAGRGGAYYLIRRTQYVYTIYFCPIALDANHSENHFLIIFSQAEIYFCHGCFAGRLIRTRGPLSRIIAVTWTEIYARAFVWVHFGLVFDGADMNSSNHEYLWPNLYTAAYAETD
jgi:hypothetical protein